VSLFHFLCGPTQNRFVVWDNMILVLSFVLEDIFH